MSELEIIVRPSGPEGTKNNVRRVEVFLACDGCLMVRDLQSGRGFYVGALETKDGQLVFGRFASLPRDLFHFEGGSTKIKAN